MFQERSQNRASKRSALLTCAATAVSLLAAVHGNGVASASAPCGGSVRTLTAPAVPLLQWSENVGYDNAGDLWVSRTASGVVQRLDHRGKVTKSVRIPFPGAIRSGPGGNMYVTSFLDTTPRLGAVLRFNPHFQSPRPTVFVRGLGLPNGLAFDTKGRGYIADSVLGLIRVDPTGRIDRPWSARAPKSLSPNAVVNGLSMNGVVAQDKYLYATMTMSITGRILRIPIDAPDHPSGAADLTAPLPGVLDDLTVLAENRLAVTSTAGTVFVVDTQHNRTVCSLPIGQPVTSVATDPTRPSVWTFGTESGAVLRGTVTLPLRPRS